MALAAPMEVVKDFQASPTEAEMACQGDSAPTAATVSVEVWLIETDAAQNKTMTRVMPSDVQNAICFLI